ncbi:hypothetical protein CDAR_289881 [Caerostris darwini]|uniref:Uncharacterized protein n=1 Tax=Caerostris darwini TaxID=1538125 RepID=A0AAV4WWS8_9ARAC|nr:hypothetical protein CDAR_289881 [Caerostris darwini]
MEMMVAVVSFYMNPPLIFIRRDFPKWKRWTGQHKNIPVKYEPTVNFQRRGSLTETLDWTVLKSAAGRISNLRGSFDGRAARAPDGARADKPLHQGSQWPSEGGRQRGVFQKDQWKLERCDTSPVKTKKA